MYKIINDEVISMRTLPDFMKYYLKAADGSIKKLIRFMISALEKISGPVKNNQLITKLKVFTLAGK